ncbi:MAG: hypothetical protein EON95_17125 [Caulobacteraceae bacterium]|nr:MAG: hypothetical protein EON95_17125 [Caulobacteraceae bacterium]
MHEDAAGDGLCRLGLRRRGAGGRPVLQRNPGAGRHLRPATLEGPIKAPPAWAVTVNCKADCEFSEPEGTRYALGDGGLLDKELKAGTATPWPWGLDSKDGPAEAKAKLSRLLPGKSLAVSPDDPATWFVVIPPCMTWIEVSFEGERGIRAVSLNAQP